MSERELHFSIGPVQSFVEQARRTRDLWAGSLLLSWMAGQAMAGILREGGVIVFPHVGSLQNPEDSMLGAILGAPEEGKGPIFGSLPNRFEARIPESSDPHAVVEGMRIRWQELAEKVWERWIAPAAGLGNGTRGIWERQIGGFWEIHWVLDHPLEERKNWRNHWPPIEGGDHCTIMGEHQELSGHVRSLERKKQDEFWSEVRKHTGRLDLRDGERLCAIALVKRLFPRLKEKEMKSTIGWKLPAPHWPSTASMAALPWLAHLGRDPDRLDSLRTYGSVPK